MGARSAVNGFLVEIEKAKVIQPAGEIQPSREKKDLSFSQTEAADALLVHPAEF